MLLINKSMLSVVSMYPQGLEEEQTFDLFKRYLMDEYRGSRGQLQVI